MELVLIGRRPLAEGAFLAMDSGTNSLVIDARGLTFACPLDLAGIVATAHWAAGFPVPVALKMPTDTDAASYLQRMDVLRLMPSRTRILGRVPPDLRADHRGRLLEVTALNPSNADDVSERLGRLISAYYADHSESAGHAVFRACGELVANAVEHGHSDAGAFVAAQTYSGSTTERPRFEFAVCDTGIGILNHLRKNAKHGHLTRDEVAISHAMRAGVSGLTGDRGNGLSDLIEHTRQHGLISFRLRSGRGEVRVSGSPETHMEVPHDRPDQTAGAWAWLTHQIPLEKQYCGSIGEMKPENR